jgi:glutamyl-tRNA reductase
MFKKFRAISLTYKTAPLRELSRFVLQSEQVESGLVKLKSQTGVEELFYLNTCNRVLFGFIESAPLTSERALAFLQGVNPDITLEDLNFCRLLSGEEAVVHFHELAASLDSLVVGEREILRQTREAYDSRLPLKLTGDHFRLLMQTTVAGAKDVFTNSRIGEKPVSVVALACAQLKQWPLNQQTRVCVVGAGQTNTTVVKFLAKYKYSNVTIFNRSLDKAQKLAELVNGRALPIEDLYSYDAGFDCLIVCTGATEPIVTPEVFKTLIGNDTQTKYIVDLSVPHNVAQEVALMPQVNYLPVEDLESRAETNKLYRQESVAEARTILKKHIDHLDDLLRQRKVEKSLTAVPERIKAVRQLAEQHVFSKQLAGLDPEARALFGEMLTFMEKQCVGIPMQVVREAVLADTE